MYFCLKENALRNLYNILTYIANFHLKIIALFNEKIKLGVRGRSQSFGLLNSYISEEDKTIWFHCASLGEYEQGFPVFEEIKAVYPDHKIVLSFFSPSGFEVKKNVPIADVVLYLPLDTKHNAKRFLDSVHPDLIVFVKYEIWPNYLFEIEKRNIKSILISAIFRKDQSFFKSHGKWMLNAIKSFDKIFVQNESSLQLLNRHSIKNVEVSGDTRFDRVFNQLKLNNNLDFLEEFKGDKILVIAGSTWREDDKLLSNFINSSYEDLKFIIAPHNIKSRQISDLKKSLNRKVVLFSEINDKTLYDYEVLILDTIGMLFKAYSYASIAIVGGAIGTTGLHNTLEPAVFGIPIIIGSNYKNFPEAFDMIKNGGMISISNQSELDSTLIDLIQNKEKRCLVGKHNLDYIEKNRGSVIQILDYLRTY